jgi:protein phosphatase
MKIRLRWNFWKPAADPPIPLATLAPPETEPEEFPAEPPALPAVPPPLQAVAAEVPPANNEIPPAFPPQMPPDAAALSPAAPVADKGTVRGRPPSVAGAPDGAVSDGPEPCIIGKFMIEAYGASDPGCVRGNNEDYYLVAPSIGLYVVADGMGGAQAGEHASKLAAETLWEIVYQDKGAMDIAGLEAAFEEANRRVMQAAATDPSLEGMGTTLVAAIERPDNLIIVSVGDSRLYLFEKGELRAVTEDQTWVNEVGRRLGLKEEALKTHPMRHVLTMAVGVSQQLRVNKYILPKNPETQMLLCSDGLHGVVSEDTIRQVLSSGESSEVKCQSLIDAARANGGPDNITVVLLKTVETPKAA